MHTCDGSGLVPYIDTKRAVLRNVGRVRNELVQLQKSMPADDNRQGGDMWERFRKIELILDDIFTGDQK